MNELRIDKHNNKTQTPLLAKIIGVISLLCGLGWSIGVCLVWIGVSSLGGFQGEQSDLAMCTGLLLIFLPSVYFGMIYLEAFSFHSVADYRKILAVIQILPLVGVLKLSFETPDPRMFKTMFFYVSTVLLFWNIHYLLLYLKKGSLSFVELVKKWVDIFLFTLFVTYPVFAYLLHRFVQRAADFTPSAQPVFEMMEGYLSYIVLLSPILYLPLLLWFSFSKFKVNKIVCRILLWGQIILMIILLITHYNSAMVSKAYLYDKDAFFISCFFASFSCLFWGLLGIINSLNNKIIRYRKPYEYL